MKRHSFVPGGSFGLIEHRVRCCGIAICAVAGALAAQAAPVFLQLAGAGEETKPIMVLAGQKTELVLSLAATEELAPQLTGDLSVVTGKTAAPLVPTLQFGLQRKEATKGGVQQFFFALEVPAVKSRQRLLLRLRLQTTAAQAEISLPSVWLDAVPSTWKESLQQFAHVVPAGRLAGDERLERLFAAAELEVPDAVEHLPITDAAVRVWFVASLEPELVLPATPPGVVWLVFKPGIGENCRVQRSADGGPLAVVVDDRALQAPADHDALAQALLERGLETARALAGFETHLTP